MGKSNPIEESSTNGIVLSDAVVEEAIEIPEPTILLICPDGHMNKGRAEIVYDLQMKCVRVYCDTCGKWWKTKMMSEEIEMPLKEQKAP